VERFFGNQFMLWSILSEIVIIVIIVYVPGLNSVFLLEAPSSVVASCAIWIIPLLLIWDEARKYICRLYPDGWVNKNTNF